MIFTDEMADRILGNAEEKSPLDRILNALRGREMRAHEVDGDIAIYFVDEHEVVQGVALPEALPEVDLDSLERIEL